MPGRSALSAFRTRPGPEGSGGFTDPSVTHGRRHPVYTAGHKASLVTAGGLPLVTITPRQRGGPDPPAGAAGRFGDLYLDLPVAYLLLDEGYDTEGCTAPSTGTST